MKLAQLSKYFVTSSLGSLWLLESEREEDRQDDQRVRDSVVPFQLLTE
jgi:hypothetical protein